MTESIHVLIVDDDALTRVGVRTVLSSEPDIVVVGEAATARQAIMFVQSVPTDVVLMDIQLPDMDGIVATQRVLAATRNADRPVRVIAGDRAPPGRRLWWLCDRREHRCNTMHRRFPRRTSRSRSRGP